MKTKQEIKDEINELYGATQALGQAIEQIMEQIHKQQMEALKKMFALNHMLQEMEGDKND